MTLRKSLRIDMQYHARLKLSLAILACLLLSQPVSAQDVSRAKLGEKIANLVFKDAQGNPHQLYDLKDQKAIVLVFLSFDCPVSTSYSQPLTDMVKEFGKHGVSIWGLTTNEDESRAEIAKRAKEFNLVFPVFKDERLIAADALKAEMTPEVFVLDTGFVLRYRGRIDDSYSERLKKHTQVTKHELRQTLAELVTGRPVSSEPTRAVGCPLPRYDKKLVKDGAVTYHRDVLPILQKNCQSCHRPGEVAPFSLMTYKQAVNWAEDIKTFTRNRTMPPWKLVAGMAFHNERRMDEKDIKTLASWVDADCPEGDPRDAPPPVKFPEGWKLGTPDLVLSPDDDMTLGPTGRDLFRCFVLPTKLAEDVYVAAIEVRPSNPRIVHHALLFIDTRGAGRKLQDTAQAELAKKPKTTEPLDGHVADGSVLDRGPGYTRSMGVGFIPQGGLSGWAPGQTTQYLPDGVGFSLPKNSDVVMQVHYHRNGRTERDRTQVGLYFARKKVDRPLQGGVIAGGSGTGALRTLFSIPPKNAAFSVDGDMWATGDFKLVSVMPHMHMVGKEITVTMTPPDGPAQTVLAIKQWDYNWQETYFLKQPLEVKSGTRLHVEAIYDNSDKNPRNPYDPPRRITFGEQTFNEMCFVFLGGYSGAGRRLPLTPLAPKKDTAQGP
jgi:peroxiredoxin/mono/diheme cytochrome c family protein